MVAANSPVTGAAMNRQMPATKGIRKSPRRVRAGRENAKKGRGLTAKGAQKIREANQRHKPWKLSTGPRTPAGRRQSSLNGKIRQVGSLSTRERAYYLSVLNAFLRDLERPWPAPGVKTPPPSTDAAGVPEEALASELAAKMLSGSCKVDRKRLAGQNDDSWRATLTIGGVLPSHDGDSRFTQGSSVIAGILEQPMPANCYRRRAHWGRSAAWLWHLSTMFLRLKRKPWKRFGDRMLRPLIKFRERWANCRSDADYRRLRRMCPALFEACQIAVQRADHPLRQCVEMLILAGIPTDQVAAKLEIRPATIAWFEAAFFDVRDRLDCPGFIAHQATLIHHYDVGSCQSRVLRHYSYCGGPIVADLLVSLFGGPPTSLAVGEPLSPLDLVRVKLHCLGRVALEVLPNDDPRLQRLMIGYRQREQERNRVSKKQRREAAGAEQAMREATRVVLERFGPLFWQNSADGELIGKKAERVRNEPQ